MQKLLKWLVPLATAFFLLSLVVIGLLAISAPNRMYPSRARAEVYEFKAAQTEDSVEKFQLLSLALLQYISLAPELSVKDYDAQGIVSQLIALNEQDSELVLSLGDLSGLAYEGNTEALQLLERCVDSTLLTFDDEDEPATLRFLLRSVEEIAQQTEEEADIPVDRVLYRETAFRIIRKVIAKGAGRNAFLSSYDEAEDEQELRRLIDTVADDELRRQMTEGGILPWDAQETEPQP